MTVPSPPEPTGHEHDATPARAADRALLWAVRAWGKSADPRFWSRFSPERREWLRQGLEQGPALDEAGADTALRRVLAAQARPDRARVHSSWWVRALRDESPSVQRTVTAHADPAIKSILQRALGLDPADLRPDHRPSGDAVRWALGLWDERIVGDSPEWPDDPPVILALCRLDLWEIVALARASGLAKRALAAAALPRLPDRARRRFDHFQHLWGQRNRSSLAVARQLFQAELKNWQRTRGWGRLGLATFGHLLAHAEAYRARWALQHLPYAVGRRIRPAIKDRGQRVTFWEGEILQAAWERLAAEGQIRSLGGLMREHRYV